MWLYSKPEATSLSNFHHVGFLWRITVAHDSPPGGSLSSTHQANRIVHSRLADVYDKTEPHFRPENQSKVKSKIIRLREIAGGGRLLDIGCGTGFMINLALGTFDDIYGVDITPEMMQHIDCSRGNITLHLASAESLPFAEDTFDAITAYSFIDHVADVDAVLREAARVLKPGGAALIDLAPNRLFWETLRQLDPSDVERAGAILAREFRMVTQNAKDIESAYGIDAATFEAAEPGKIRGGIDWREMQNAALHAGFSTCATQFEWFLGQGTIMHGKSVATADSIDGYLRDVIPVVRHLYKYLSFHLIK